MNPTKSRLWFVTRNIAILRRMAGTAVMTVAMLFAQGAISATYNYQITDPMVGTSLTDLNTAFWEPWIGPPGSGGASETGYVSIPNSSEIFIEGYGVTG